jgi:nitrate reductase cytochrome c-type subunit
VNYCFCCERISGDVRPMLDDEFSDGPSVCLACHHEALAMAFDAVDMPRSRALVARAYHDAVAEIAARFCPQCGGLHRDCLEGA